jgi:hypothetical protein
MGKIRPPRFSLSFIVGLVCSGCSLISTNSDVIVQMPKDFRFKQTVSQTSNLVTTPVEVAKEFNYLVNDSDSASAQDIARQLSQTGTQNEESDEEGQGVPTLKNGQPRSLTKSKRNNKFLGPIGRLPANFKNRKGSTKYKVRPGDTLMMISFMKFGNVYRWREIYKMNQTSIADFNRLVPGQEILFADDTYAIIQKNGKPYLIKRHDTLIKVSRLLYNTSDKWRDLWQNNTQLIHDPNKIYAGFTLYYLDLAQDLAKRQAASQMDPKPATKTK